MSSINKYPTFQYSQPQAYRFSHDSVFLARAVFEYTVKYELNRKSVLDLCSGCGIVGLDFLFHLRTEKYVLPLFFDFLEVQHEYQSHFIENVKRLGPIQTQIQLLLENYSEYANKYLDQKYDLILCNPPYFSKGQGKWPGSELKFRSRFFVDSDLENLVHFIHTKLTSSGAAFILVRNQLEHNVDQINVLQMYCDGKLNIQHLGDIRGTHLVMLKSKIT